MRVAVTSSRDDPFLQMRAEQIALELSIPYLARKKNSLESLRKTNSLDYILVVEQDNVVMKGDTTLFWHPSMAVPRTKALRKGQNDLMIEAMKIEPGYHVLDCTLGLAADALVAAYAVGSEGNITGLEANKYVAFLTKWGLQHFSGHNKHIMKVMNRITVLNCSFKEYLPNQPDNCFDVVYFDPMFYQGRNKSSAINALRPLAVYDNVTNNDINEAFRVARYRVVLKQAVKKRPSSELKAHFYVGGRYSPIEYGVWEK